MLIKPETQRSLLQFAQRGIKKGESFLLARLIADRIPAGESVVTTQPWEQTLKHRPQVDNVIFFLNDYLHISSDEARRICQMVERIWLWRQSVACGKSNLIYSGDANSVVDDTTGILRTVNLDDICPLADVVQDANFIYGVFKDVVSANWH